MTVKGIFDIIAGVWPTEQPLGIGVVFREQESGPVVHLPSVGIEKIVAGSRMGQVHPRNAFRSTYLFQYRPSRDITHGTCLVARAPGVSKPDRWQDIQRGCLRAAVMGGDPDQHILGVCLGIFNENIKVAPVIKDASVG